MSKIPNLHSHVYFTKKFFKSWKTQNQFTNLVLFCNGLLTKLKVYLATLKSLYDPSIVDKEQTLTPLEWRLSECLEQMCPQLKDGLRGSERKKLSTIVMKACFYCNDQNSLVSVEQLQLDDWQHTQSVVPLLAIFGIVLKKETKRKNDYSVSIQPKVSL